MVVLSTSMNPRQQHSFSSSEHKEEKLGGEEDDELLLCVCFAKHAAQRLADILLCFRLSSARVAGPIASRGSQQHPEWTRLLKR